MVNNNPIQHPPIARRQHILEQYHNNLQTMDYIDAFVIYEHHMHKLYVVHNPWLARTPDGRPRRTRTRKDFMPKNDKFGVPLQYLKMTEEEFESYVNIS
jgi:hypothetical protein